MADPPEKTDLELKAPDALAAAVQPTISNDSQHTRPEPTTSSPPITGAEASSGDDEKIEKGPEDIGGRSRPNELNLTKSYATDASAATAATAAAAQNVHKPWYKKMNPLRWGGIPKVPDEPLVSREYPAGFFSKLTFQWMTPLMSVSRPSEARYPRSACYQWGAFVRAQLR